MHATVTLALESEPGMRLVVKAKPSSVTDQPPESFDEWVRHLEGAGNASLPIEQLHLIYERRRKRYEVWLTRVQEHGQAAIHSRPALQRLLANEEHWLGELAVLAVLG